VAERPSWECEETNHENTSDTTGTRFRSRRLARHQVVCLAAGVSPREWDKGYEEANCRTTKAPSHHAVCRTGCAQGETLPSRGVHYSCLGDYGEVRGTQTTFPRAYIAPIPPQQARVRWAMA
jgi:hypothetical protein